MLRRGSVQHEEKASTHLHLFQPILCANDSENVLTATLLHFASQQQLIQDEVCLLEVEYDVELAHVAVVFVHLFNVSVNNLKGQEFIVGGICGCDEEEGGITAVDDLGVCREAY